MRRFELSEGTSHKFWSIACEGDAVTVRYGRIGTNGQEQIKQLGSAAEATKEANKLIASKVKKGYAEVDGDDAPSAKPPAAKPTATKPAATATSNVDYTTVTMQWTPELESHVYPFRGTGTPPRPAKEAKPDALFKKAGEVMRTYEKRWVAGDALASARGTALSQAVRARLNGTEPTDFDAELEAATLQIAVATLRFGGKGADSDKLAERMVEHWVAKHGLANAARAVADTGRIHAVRNTNTIHIIVRAHGADGAEPDPRHEAQWLALRGWLAHAPEAEYVAVRDELVALDAALRGKSKADHATRTSIAVALPDVEDLSRALLAFEKEHKGYWSVASLVSCRIDAAAARAIFADRYAAFHATQFLPTMVAHFGDGAWAVLRDFELSEHADVEPKKAWIRAMSVFVGDEPATRIAAHLEAKSLRSVVGDYFERHPALALRVLPDLAKKGKKATREAVSAVLATAQHAVDAGAGNLDAPGSKSDDKGAMPSAPSAPTTVARAESLPEVLRDPPWRRKGSRPTLTPRALAIAAAPAELDWDDARREREAGRTRWERGGGDARDIEALQVAIQQKQPARVSCLLCVRDRDQARALLHAVRDWGYAEAHHIRAVIGHFGEADAEHIARIVLGDLSSLEGAADLGSAHLARPIAAAYGRRKLRPVAQRWMLAFPRHAALGLIAVALGDDARERKNAQAALRFLASKLASNNQNNVLRDAAAAYGDDVAREVVAWLEIDPLLDVPAKPPKLPSWFDAARLPHPTLRDGAALDDTATAHLVEMLAFSEPDPPYEGIAQVKDACDAGSLDTFARALCETWVADGAKSAHSWAVYAVGLLGSDASARWMAQRVDAWAQEGSKPKGALGLEVMGQIGTDVALMYVARWARGGRRQWLKDGGLDVLESVAAARGLTPDELEDRTAPDLDLADDGSRVLDYGPRQFRVVFDEHLAPSIVDSNGERLRAIPPVRKDDDATLAKAAKEAWATLKKEADAVAAGQVERLERAMATQRRWSAADFATFLIAHPLVRHLSHRLVFGVYEGGDMTTNRGGVLTATFRAAPDGTYATPDDEAFALPEAGSTTIGIVHPLDLDTELAHRWSTVLADYELLQPFPQVGRAVHRATDAEKKSTKLTRGDDIKAYTGRLYALRARGWRLDGDPFYIIEMIKSLGGGRSAHLRFHPGIDTQAREMTEHALHGVTLLADTTATPLAWGQVDPITFSELVNDVESLRG